MSSEAQDLLELAKKLPREEREALAEAIWDTLEDEPASLSPEWTTEVKSRIAQLESGEVKAVPWSEVEARIRRTLERQG
ncbi:MAG: addiction module protein [Myxococcales bacterium]|nr:addiction module protein [Myxococcales bacterium]